MQKPKTKILTILLLSAMALAMFPLAVNASTGFILINATVAPSPTTSIPAGGNISLNFAGVTFSGGQFYLLLSQDGFSQVSPGDIRFTPSFSLNTLQTVGNTTVTDATGVFPGTWYLGTSGANSWVSGTIPSNIAGGPYFIKCFDGAVTSLAVTDKAFTVTASFSIAPTSGAAGTSLTLSGNAFPASALVNVTYLNAFVSPAATVTVSNLTQTGSIGNFSMTIPAPDLKQAAAIGDNALATNQVVFTAQDNKTQTMYTATYTEAQRGVLQFGRPGTAVVTGSLQNATTGIFGNLTTFVSTVSVGVGDSVRVVGNSFYPGNMTLKWDNAIDITVPASRTANGTGFFNTTVTVPTTGNGPHNITIVDSNSVAFVVFLNVVQSITISPTSGPIGTTVTVGGFGFPASGAGTVYNATITFDPVGAKGWALTDANGAFTTTITVPTAAGGQHAITATTNDTSSTSATKTFTITANFAITPTSFYANDSTTVVTASGTGFNPALTFFVTIDNLFTPFTNTTNGVAPNSAGNLSLSFIGVGFQPGLHIVTLYQAGSGSGPNSPIANATFTVLTDPSSVLGSINKTVTTINTNVAAVQTTLTALNATLIAINGNTATLSTSIGTLTTSINSVQSSVAGLSGLTGSITSINSGIASVQTTLGSIQTSLTSLDAVLGAVAGDTATIKTSLGDITTSLASINTVVTRIDGNVATIQTSLGTLTGTVNSIKDGVATIQTSLGTMQANIGTLQTDVTSTKDNTASLSPLIIVAIVLALVAAIAAIASIVLMRRKIAG